MGMRGPKPTGVSEARIAFRTSYTQSEIIEEKAEELGVSQSELIRTAIDEGIFIAVGKLRANRAA